MTHDLAAGPATGCVKSSEEILDRLSVEHVFWPRRHQFAIAQPDGTEVTDALASGRMQADRIFVSGGTHLRQREPCCWKWTSSRAHRSIPGSAARRRSFLCAACNSGSAWATCGRGLRKRNPNCRKKALTLAYFQVDAELTFQECGQGRAVPQVCRKTEIQGTLTPVRLRLRRVAPDSAVSAAPCVLHRPSRKIPGVKIAEPS